MSSSTSLIKTLAQVKPQRRATRLYLDAASLHTSSSQRETGPTAGPSNNSNSTTHFGFKTVLESAKESLGQSFLCIV